MSKRTRRNHTSDQKAALLKKHHLDKVAVSDICNEAELQPSLFYYWQRHLFENAAAAFDGPGAKASVVERHERDKKQLEARIVQLEAKLARKDAVIAEISEEFVTLKKTLGGP